MRKTAAAERREIGGGTMGFFRCEVLSVIYCFNPLCFVVGISFFQERYTIGAVVDYPYQTLGFLLVYLIVFPEGQLSGRFSIIGLRNGISKRTRDLAEASITDAITSHHLPLARLPSNDSCPRSSNQSTIETLKKID